MEAAPEWIDRLTRLLRENVFFSILNAEELQWLAGRLEMVTHSLGETIITEGEPGGDAYLVLSGRLRVVKRSTSGKQVTLGTATSGDLVGEQAILSGGTRTATVRVSEDAVLFRLRQDDFAELLQRNSKLRQYFTEHIQERAVVEFLRLATFVGALPAGEVTALLDRLEACEFATGETIISEGEPGDRMFIILAGEVKAVHRNNGDERVLSYLADGDFFGERSLLVDEPRSATVIATTPTRCFSLSREHFDTLLDSAPSIRAHLAERIEQYNVSEEQEARFGLRQPARRERRHLSFSQPESALPTANAASASSDEPQQQEATERRQKLRIGRRSKRYSWIPQHDETDCGAASLAMVAKYHGIRLSVGKLRDQASVGREGASLYSLSAAAEQLGFRTRAVRADYESLQQFDLPAVAHWKGYHYVVVYEVGPDRVVLGDPAIGLVRMSRAEFEDGWTGRLLLLQPTPKLEQIEPERSTWGRFVPLLRPHHSLLVEILLASLVLELLQLASPIFTQTIVDRVLVHQNVNMLNIMLGGMVIIGLFQTATIVLRQTLLIHVSQKLELRMASDLFHHILYLPMRFFHTRHIGDLLKRFKDNDQVQRMLTSQGIATLLDVLMMFTTLALMLYYNVKLTLVAVAAIPIYVGLTLIFTPLLKRNNQREFEQEAKTESALVESVQSIETIKACTAELSSQWRYEDHIVRTANTEIRGARLAMTMHGASRAVGIFASTFLLWYGAHLVIQRELTVGQLMAFQALIGMLTAPIMALIAVWTQLQDTALSLQRLNDIYSSELEQPPERTAVHLPALRGSIRLEDVSFRYDLDDKNILSGINLEIQPGQTVAIVGRSGSGKSTLIRLLQRYYLPTEGRILVDGYDLTSVDLRSYRSQLGVVPQDATIFSGTIRENIALADPEASMDRIISAAKLAAADEFIRGLPMGYDTVVGGVGVQLSGGQKQRVCIARALLTDPRLLIFDEATSSLDTESERMIQQNMKAILLQRTSIIIAHRLSTVQHADLIVVLDDGVVVEKGGHRELMQLRGLYFYLTSQQMGT